MVASHSWLASVLVQMISRANDTSVQNRSILYRRKGHRSGHCANRLCSLVTLEQAQQTQSLFSTDFPLADKILSTKGVHDEFYVKHRA